MSEGVAVREAASHQLSAGNISVTLENFMSAVQPSNGIERKANITHKKECRFETEAEIFSRPLLQ